MLLKRYIPLSPREGCLLASDEADRSVLCNARCRAAQEKCEVFHLFAVGIALTTEERISFTSLELIQSHSVHTLIGSKQNFFAQ